MSKPVSFQEPSMALPSIKGMRAAAEFLGIDCIIYFLPILEEMENVVTTPREFVEKLIDVIDVAVETSDEKLSTAERLNAIAPELIAVVCGENASFLKEAEAIWCRHIKP